MAAPFSDDYTGAGADTALDAWTPTISGTGYTVLVGGSGSLVVDPTGNVQEFALIPIQYVSDDHADPDNYIEYKVVDVSGNTSNCYVCTRFVDPNNFIGIRIFGTGALGLRLTEVVGGVVNDLISVQPAGTGEWYRLEVNGAVAKLFTGGTGATPGTWVQVGGDQTITVSQTETKQGFRPNDNSGIQWLDAYNSGALAVDTTPPVLTLPTGTQTGSTTASGTVTTDEGNGTLFYLATVNATETAATIKAGSSQAVSAIGVQNVTVTGLTPATTYFLHYVHDDAATNESNVVTSASFTTDAVGGFNPVWANRSNNLIGGM